MLTKDDVQKIAHLARLNLTDAELEKFMVQLNAILKHAEDLNEVDTENVEPISQITGLENQNQADDVNACQNPSEFIEQTPQSVHQNMIKVKNVF